MTDDFVGEALAVLYAIERDDRIITAYLVGRARMAAIEATKRLLLIEPDDEPEIRRQQFEVRRLYDLIRWLREAMDTGHEIIASMDTTERETVLAEVFGQDNLMNDA